MLLKKHPYPYSAHPLQKGPHATPSHSFTCPRVALSGADDWASAHSRWCSTWMFNLWSSGAQPAWESISPLIHPLLPPHLAADVVSLWHKEFPKLRETGVSRDPLLPWIAAICKCQVNFSFPPDEEERLKIVRRKPKVWRVFSMPGGLC